MNIRSEIDAIPEKIRSMIRQRLAEFQQEKSDEVWFSELCFCILTANSRADTALAIERELGPRGFLEVASKDLRKCIIKHKHRFHNNKTKYIVEARRFPNIRDIIQKKVDESGQTGAREWLVSNITGLGYKEASHFLRNVGYSDLAILDRHILRLMSEHGMIKRPMTLSKSLYLDIEKVFIKTAELLKMNCAELDLNMWYLCTGRVLK